MAKLTMKDVREIRVFVLKGYPIRVIAEMFKVSESTVRSYTKAERNKVG